MTLTPEKREQGAFADLFDRLEAGFPLFRSFAGAHMMRVEENLQAGEYVLRAELPGIDPDKDVEISIANGVLSVTAERREGHTEQQRSEFRYGRFSRSVTLPTGVDEDDVRATYRDGILEVRVGIKGEPTAQTKRIPISRS